MQELIELYDLTKNHLPFSVEAYNTDQGDDGFAIFTKNGQRITFDCGSYGYDTRFSNRKEAQKNADFLEKII